ncbi:MAG: carboxypeptidase-like regulatory domain-containing protein, partial [Planctomycetota bacterium]
QDSLLQPRVPASAGGPAALASSSLAVFSLMGTLLMKKVVLSLAVLGLMLLVTWQLRPREFDSAYEVTGEVPAASPAELAPVGPSLSQHVPLDDVQAVRVDALRSRALDETPGPSADAALAIEGTLAVEGTVVPPPPTDVSIWVRSGFSSEGRISSRHQVRSDAAGRFRLEIERPDETVTLTARAEVDGCLPSGGTVVTVPRREERASLDLTFLRRDTVVHGVVFEPGGKPASGARVLWNKFTAECDEEGAYEITVAPRYVYRIYAEKAGLGRTAAVAADLEPGVRHRIDFTLTEGFSIRGVVRDEDGEALEGVQVSSFFRHDRVETDIEGRFVIGCISRTDRGQVELTARHPDFVSSSEVVVVPATGDLAVELVLRRGVGVLGKVVRADGQPLPGVELVLGPGRNYHQALTAYSDDRGDFEFSAVEPGEQIIWASANGYADLRHDLLVPMGPEAVTDVILRLDEGLTVRGRIEDESGLPVEGVSISMRLDSSGPRPGPYVGGRARTGEAGAFELACLPAGSLIAEAYAKGWVRGRAPVRDDGTVVVTLRRAGQLRGRVVDGVTGAPVDAFRIRAVDPLLRDGEVRASGYEAGWAREGVAFEDPNGRWELGRAELAPGSVLGIEASAAGYAPAIEPRAVVQVSDSSDEVVLELWRAVDVMVAVTEEATGAPVPRARVVLSQERHLDEMDRSWSGLTESDGRALVRSAAPGPLWIRVQRPPSADGAGETSGQEPHILGPYSVEPQPPDGTSEPRRIDVAIP